MPCVRQSPAAQRSPEHGASKQVAPDAEGVVRAAGGVVRGVVRTIYVYIVYIVYIGIQNIQNIQKH